MHYSLVFFHISLTLVLFLCSFLCCAYVSTCFMLQFISYAAFSCYTIFIYTIFSVACFHGALLPSSFFYNLLLLHIKVPPCCIFFHVVFFSCHTFNFFFIFLSLLIFFHVALFSYSALLCCTFFILHF